MAEYSHAFYTDRHQKTLCAAETILSLLLERIPIVNSAVDVGCGVGTWLSVLVQRGTKDVLGLDGSWVDRNLLVVDELSFREADLTLQLDVERRFDLAISLEVAEHLPAQGAEAFVASLIALSDFVLFSAGIPFQGGKSHVNEQWPDYWAALFNTHDYVTLDFIRGQIWTDRGIPTWYKQNILFFVKRNRLGEVRIALGELCGPLLIVHPELYLAKHSDMSSVRGSWTLFASALKATLRRRLSRSA